MVVLKGAGWLPAREDRTSAITSGKKKNSVRGTMDSFRPNAPKGRLRVAGGVDQTEIKKGPDRCPTSQGYRARTGRGKNGEAGGMDSDNELASMPLRASFFLKERKGGDPALSFGGGNLRRVKTHRLKTAAREEGKAFEKRRYSTYNRNALINSYIMHLERGEKGSS